MIDVRARRSVVIGALLAMAAAVIPAAIGSAQAAGQVEAAAQTPLQIETSAGSLIRLDRAAATVFVADPEIADIQVKSPRLIYVLGKKPGETTLYAVDANEQVIIHAPLRVVHNLARLKQEIRAAVPNADVGVSSIGGGIMLTGVVGTAIEADNARRIARKFVPEKEEIINGLTVDMPNQVNLRVKVAEMQRDVVKRLSVNVSNLTKTFTTLGGDIFSLSLLTGATSALSGSLAGLQTRTNRLGFGFDGQNLDVNTLIDALESEGLITTLAEPNLTAVSGETASFLAGGEFPIPVAQEDNKITIEFKKFGVSLAFTPTVLSPERLSLRVRPEVSALSNQGAITLSSITIPAISTRQAETTVELGSGQSFALAGLLRNNMTTDVSKYPGLADLPIIGPLFRSNGFNRNETELVIIATPYLVRPVSDKRLAGPTDALVPASDIERQLYGHTYRQKAREGQPIPVGPEGRRLTGPAGFVLE